MLVLFSKNYEHKKRKKDQQKIVNVNNVIKKKMLIANGQNVSHKIEKSKS